MRPMKMVVAIVKPPEIEDVKQSLSSIGIDGMTVSEVRQRQPGVRSPLQRARIGTTDLEPNLRLEVASDDTISDAIVAAMKARLGASDDGMKLFVLPLLQVTQIGF